ncbi:MAG: IcmT/TraK family protein [Desulfobacteraceae bacterium]
MQWRDTAIYPKLGPIDARCALTIPPALLPIATWKVVLAAMVVIFFWAINQRNITLGACLRMARCKLAGPLRTKMNARIWRRRCRD